MLRVRDLVRELDVSEGTIRAWTKKGILPDRRDRYGKRVFTEEDIKSFKDSIFLNEKGVKTNARSNG